MHGLPRDAATWRQENEWTWQDELAAAQIETADKWGRIVALGLGWKQHQLPKPIAIPRPAGVRPRRQVETDPERIRAFFAGR